MAMHHEELEALRGHFSNELRASDGALSSSQAALATTRRLLDDAQGQLRHNEHAKLRHDQQMQLAHPTQASNGSRARDGWRQPSHVGSAPIAVGLLLQEVRDLERWIDEAALAHRRQAEAERLQDFYAAQLQGQEAEERRRAEEREGAVAHAREEAARLHVALHVSGQREAQALALA